MEIFKNSRKVVGSKAPLSFVKESPARSKKTNTKVVGSIPRLRTQDSVFN